MITLKKAAALLSALALILTCSALTVSADGANTVAHWRLQNIEGYYTGSIDSDNLTFMDLTGNGNDLVTAVAGNGAQLDSFLWDEGANIGATLAPSSLKFDNTKAKAASVDTYGEDETSWTGGYTSGKYLETVASAPMNAMDFANGFTFEIIFKLSPDLDNNYNRYVGMFSRQGVVDGQNEPPFSMAIAEWNNDDSTGTLNEEETWLQYVHIDDSDNKTNNELGDYRIDAKSWHHFMLVADGSGVTTAYLDGEEIATFDESCVIHVTDPSYSWEVGVGRKDGTEHASDSKNENVPEGMIRRLFAGSISEIRVMDGAISVDDSLLKKEVKYAAAVQAPVEAPAAEAAPETTPVVEAAPAPAAEAAPAPAPAAEPSPAPAAAPVAAAAPAAASAAPQTFDFITIAAIAAAASLAGVVISKKR